MATEKTDVVIVGVGAAGGILAAELGKAGMKVIGLERGPRLTTQDFNPHDELRYFQRQDLRPNIKRQPVTWRPNTDARANADAGAQQRQPGRRRHRALRRGLVAHARGRFPRALAHHRALRRVRDPGGFLARRLAVELRRSRAVLRPRRIRARRVGQGRQSAGQEDRRRQRVRSTAPARISAAAVAGQDQAEILFDAAGAQARLSPVLDPARHHLAAVSRAGRAAPIAASARPSAAMSARSRRSSSPSCRRPTPPAISSSSPAPLLPRQQRQQRPGDRRLLLRSRRLGQHDRGRARHPHAVHLRQHPAAAAVEDREIPQRSRQFERPRRQAPHGAHDGERVRRLRRPASQHLHGAERAEAYARRLQRRQFRPQGSGLHPRRADLDRHRQPARAARSA